VKKYACPSLWSQGGQAWELLPASVGQKSLVFSRKTVVTIYCQPSMYVEEVRDRGVSLSVPSTHAGKTQGREARGLPWWGHRTGHVIICHRLGKLRPSSGSPMAEGFIASYPPCFTCTMEWWTEVGSGARQTRV
jgi:hypothetical protein